MNRLLELLLSVLGPNFDWTTLLGVLAAKLLEGVEDPGGCKERLLQLLRSGTLDDEFAKNPVGVLLCIGHVLMALADKLDNHDHAITMDGPWVGDLAEAMNVTAPAEGGADILIMLLMRALTEILARFLNR